MTGMNSIYNSFVSESTATFELASLERLQNAAPPACGARRGLPYQIAELEEYIVGYYYSSRFRPCEGYRFIVEDSIYLRSDCIVYGVGKRWAATRPPGAAPRVATG